MWAAAELGMILVTEKGLTPGRALAVYGRLGGLHARHAAYAAAEDETDAFGPPVELVPRAGVLQGELGGGEGHLGEPVGAGRELAVHEVVRLEVRALGGDPHLEALRIEERYGAGAALVGQQRAPEPLPADPYGADHPHTRYVSLRASVLHLAP
jgi:hypothetical protein